MDPELGPGFSLEFLGLWVKELELGAALPRVLWRKRMDTRHAELERPRTCGHTTPSNGPYTKFHASSFLFLPAVPTSTRREGSGTILPGLYHGQGSGCEIPSRAIEGRREG
jgi:hypothetical protein